MLGSSHSFCEGGFSSKEVDFLLHNIESIQPLYKEKWGKALIEHKELFKFEKPSEDRLKRKFASLHQKRILTGDQWCPDDLEKAERMRFAMTERANIFEGMKAATAADKDFTPPTITEDVAGDFGVVKGDANVESHRDFDAPAANFTPFQPQPLHVLYRHPVTAKRNTVVRL